MVVAVVGFFEQMINYFLLILLPVLVLYFIYLIITKAFNDMGFSTLEAILIVFVSFLLGSGLIDEYIGVPLSNIPLFQYETNWVVGINVGGAVIPLFLSCYLIVKNKLRPLKVLVGIGIVMVVTFFVTTPDPEKGIVSVFPYWILPILVASLFSVFLAWNEKKKAAPFAYIIGTLGVLFGADGLHLMGLLQQETQTVRSAVIGGASVFDMVFITGILAVFLDGLFILQDKRKRKG
jgi:uncharacterized membrane protein